LFKPHHRGENNNKVYIRALYVLMPPLTRPPLAAGAGSPYLPTLVGQALTDKA